MKKVIDLTGMKLGKLTVMSRAENTIYPYGGMAVNWNCLCECGRTAIVRGAHLKSGHHVGCGHCMHSDGENYKRNYNKMNETTDKLIKNEHKVINNTVEVMFSNSDKVMTCDLEDWEELKFRKWTVNGDGYANARFKEQKTSLFFHRVVMNCPRGLIVDHINGNRLDNRKCNLRIVTITENNHNKATNSNNTSGTPGVYAKRGKWISGIGVNGKYIRLGCHDCYEGAVQARKEAEKKYWSK